MYTLYYSPGSCSMAIHIALNECNQPVTLKKVDLMSGEQRSPEFMAINPRGQVPVLTDGKTVMREGAAILIHLYDKYNNPLLPKSEPARSQAIEWLMFCNATLHPAYARCFFIKRNISDPAAQEQAMTAAVSRLNDLWSDVEARLSNSPYLCGSQPTAADLLLTVIANWSGNVGKPVNIGSNTKRLLKEISQRPAYQKAMQAEQVEYQAAA
ncbi:MAG: glutathione S-transferase family protein [Alphaproteobacteria bacterium]|nr:glutathione S-transferase family protein [Alphaproteobacteria bacterium]MBV8549184.1 glutathione S-transferase family protein [Alphaproteobacteria bacterium]